jgi:hypothetical protein
MAPSALDDLDEPASDSLEATRQVRLSFRRSGDDGRSGRNFPARAGHEGGGRLVFDPQHQKAHDGRRKGARAFDGRRRIKNGKTLLPAGRSYPGGRSSSASLQ